MTWIYYTPTLEVASVKLPEVYALDGICEDEGQNAPIERCRLPRGRLAHEADEWIARHFGASRERERAMAGEHAVRIQLVATRRECPTFDGKFRLVRHLNP
jgi:hypothetical protein